MKTLKMFFSIFAIGIMVICTAGNSFAQSSSLNKVIITPVTGGVISMISGNTSTVIRQLPGNLGMGGVGGCNNPCQCTGRGCFWRIDITVGNAGDVDIREHLVYPPDATADEVDSRAHLNEFGLYQIDDFTW